MTPADRPVHSLRERKQQRVREAIVDAAYALFAERGFDNVTVSDIAERAEVGRSTFFRYFGDKQEVVFADDSRGPTTDLAALATPLPGRPIGDSLPAALAQARGLVLSFVEQLVLDPERYTVHEQLVAQHPELQARSLVKLRKYADLLAATLADRGADSGTAVLTAELAIACYIAGHSATGGGADRLVHAVAAAFDRVSKTLSQA